MTFATRGRWMPSAMVDLRNVFDSTLTQRHLIYRGVRR
jgi:hypothetical protein